MPRPIPAVPCCYTNVWPNKFHREEETLMIQRGPCLVIANAFPWGDEKAARICTSHLQRVLCQKQSPRATWKQTQRKSTVSTLIKQGEGLQFLHVVIQTNYHCISENFSLKTNTRNKSCLWQTNIVNRRSYRRCFFRVLVDDAPIPWAHSRNQEQHLVLFLVFPISCFWSLPTTLIYGHSKELGKDQLSTATGDHHQNQAPFLSLKQLINITHIKFNCLHWRQQWRSSNHLKVPSNFSPPENKISW